MYPRSQSIVWPNMGRGSLARTPELNELNEILKSVGIQEAAALGD
jgi:hypothetical protein